MHDETPFAGLEGVRIRLVPFEEGHISERYIGWLNDPEVVRYSVHRHYRHDRRSCEAFLESMRGSGSIFAAILLKGDNGGARHVGNIAVNFDPPNATADMSILIGERDVWGTGIGTEAWLLLQDHLLEACGVRKLTAGAVEQNVGMLRIMENAGMHIEARRERQYVVDGREVDLLYGARFR